jgi:OOP family OmpA-OmpF porin
MKMLFRVFIALSFLLSTHAGAQSKFYRGTIGFASGTTQYDGEIFNDFYSFRTTNPFSAIQYSHYICKQFDLRLGAAFGSWGFTSKKSNSFDADFVNVNLDVKWKFIKRENPRWSPYAFAGVGMNQFSNWTLFNSAGDPISYDTQYQSINNDELQKWKGIFSAGLGVQLRLAERVFLHFDERLLLPHADASDGIISKQNDFMLRHTVGIAIGLFPWRDSDRDGVSDKEDKCADTPPVAKIDAFGCPVDSDKDGIADFEDVCVDVPGPLSGKGCPDADGDSFVDDKDDCPSVFGINAFNGCPDSDDDGIKDIDDRCPDVKGSQQLNGCPDSDEDGVADPDDKCSNTPKIAKVNEFGCPLDRDNDGVADYEDRCPDVAGTFALKGCPEVKEEVTELFKRALNGIKFESGKNVIKKESFAILDTVVSVMLENPLYMLNIYGHTDSVGLSEKNMDLSQSRADAVALYLFQHGLENKVKQVKGFGDQKPIADNATKEGRILNRRVEFEVVFE